MRKLFAAIRRHEHSESYSCTQDSPRVLFFYYLFLNLISLELNNNHKRIKCLFLSARIGLSWKQSTKKKRCGLDQKSLPKS